MVTPAKQDDAGSRCLALVVGYHHDIDTGRATAGIDVFTDDAELEAHGKVLVRQTVHVLAHESPPRTPTDCTAGPSGCSR
ncbi:hypothetical protein OV320_0890 [Actinobacteria bacterium OV320]|nr:hypothetical protein OV320_0890 [Actinobacteria bacterium OV320]